MKSARIHSATTLVVSAPPDEARALLEAHKRLSLELGHLEDRAAKILGRLGYPDGGRNDLARILDQLENAPQDRDREQASSAFLTLLLAGRVRGHLEAEPLTLEKVDLVESALRLGAHGDDLFVHALPERRAEPVKQPRPRAKSSAKSKVEKVTRIAAVTSDAVPKRSSRRKK